ncbi:DUF2817 domain-containing protein [Pseudomonas marginalis]|uniref:DUF2817 domain-containing protein n=1 Tax=Pseudomonas marginalis TaxID=298 RepID=UPI002A36716F|nr:DUF2817 domain-containing protein [Pseudomonas marginalis]WPN25851.1 DUF2817 domain-containing protein [Pseudomonas marginalis]
MSDSYSSTYAEARQKFLSLASRRNAKVISTSHPSERGVEGEELAIDIAIFGDPNAEKTLFLVSGTHGQEGYYGSALQIEFLRDLKIPEEVNIVALHGLNPWGFSHLSRTDHQNIDVNRNFTNYGVPSERDELYPRLFRALCPDDWTEETIDWSNVRDELTREYGAKRLVSAAGGGQIIEPTGMNYIGSGPSWSRSVVENLLPKIFARSKKIAFIEWHTGLGDFGELSHIPMMEPGSDGYERMFEWLGDDARSTWARGMGDFDGATPDYRGWFSAWLPSTAPQAEWTGMVIEAGTYGVVEVMDGIRIDRWLKFGKGRSYQSRDEMRITMMDKLYPVAPDWRAAALSNGIGAQHAFLEGLQKW